MEQAEEEYHTFVAPQRSSFIVPFAFVAPLTDGGSVDTG